MCLKGMEVQASKYTAIKELNMVLERWDPYRELRRVEDRMGRLWRGFGRWPVSENSDVESWTIPLDVVKEGDNIVVHASLPGVKPEDIEVAIDEDVLTIRGSTKVENGERKGDYLIRERRSGSFHRSLRLPDTLDKDKVKSRYDSGVLSITFPKVEAKKGKQVKVEVGS